jgi:hypothetical protein
VETIRRDQLTQSRASSRELPEDLAERSGFDLDLGDTGAFSGDTQKFNKHDGPVRA